MKKWIVEIGINLICGLISGSIVSAILMPQLKKSEYLNTVLISELNKNNLDVKDVERMLKWGIENKVSPSMLIDLYSGESNANE